MTDKRIMMTTIRLLLVAVFGLALAACSNNPMMRTTTATSTDVASSIDQEMAKAERQAATSGSTQPGSAATRADISSQLLPSLSTNRQQDERFDVNAAGIPAASFFAALVEGTRYNVVVRPNVDTAVDLRLTDVTIPEVMDIAADLYGLNIRKTGRLYRVGTNEEQTRLFPIDYLHFKRQGNSDTRVSSGQVSSSRGGGSAGTGGGDTQSGGSRNLVGTAISTETESDFWQDITRSLEMIVSRDGGQVIVNAGAGLVMVRADPAKLDIVEDYLRRTELIMQRQVVLEAKILEVALDESYEQGINWSEIQTTSDSSTRLGGELVGQAIRVGDIGGLFSATITEGNFGAVIELLGQQGNVQILSSPRISTTNNQKAVIKVGTDEFFVTDIDFDNDTTAGTTTESTSTSVELTPFFSGISLDVTPQISEEGNIILHVHPAVSEVEDQQKLITVGQRDVTLPLARSTVRETDSVIRAESGQIVVIGGLIQNRSEDSNSAVPFFSDIPLIGELFKQRNFQSRKSELVILLRPVVSSPGQMQADVQDSRERMNVLRELLNSTESVTPQPETAPR